MSTPERREYTLEELIPFGGGRATQDANRAELARLRATSAALDHYDECRALLDDARRDLGPDSGEYLRAEQARRIALVLLDAALATTGRGGGTGGRMA